MNQLVVFFFLVAAPFAWFLLCDKCYFILFARLLFSTKTINGVISIEWAFFQSIEQLPHSGFSIRWALISRGFCCQYNKFAMNAFVSILCIPIRFGGFVFVSISLTVSLSLTFYDKITCCIFNYKEITSKDVGIVWGIYCVLFTIIAVSTYKHVLYTKLNSVIFFNFKCSFVWMLVSTF